MKTRKSIVALAVLMAALASVPAHAQLIDMSTVNLTRQVDYLGDFKGYFTTYSPTDWGLVSTGTGTLDPFLSVQSNQDAPEVGINSNGPYVYDEVSGGTRTRPLPRTLSSVIQGKNIPGISTVPGVDCSADPTDFQCARYYREFLLDANEDKSTPTNILMSELKVFISKAPNDTTGGAPAFDGSLSMLESWAAGSLYGTVKAFDLDLQDTNGDGVLDPVDRAVLVDYTVSSSGSGRPDLTIYLPRIYATAATHVYFYTRFGCSTDTASPDYDANCTAEIATVSAGFEEWAVRSTVVNQEVPAPPAILGAFAAFGYMRKLRRRLKAHQASQLAA